MTVGSAALDQEYSTVPSGRAVASPIVPGRGRQVGDLRRRG
jgi:hypothetical protein